MIHADTAVSFVQATVHITIQHKIHISVIINADDLNIMFIPGISGIPL